MKLKLHNGRLVNIELFLLMWICTYCYAKDSSELNANSDYLETLEPKLEIDSSDYNTNSEFVFENNLPETTTGFSEDVNRNDFNNKISTKSLEENIDDYYNGIDVEFENLSENDKRFVVNALIGDESTSTTQTSTEQINNNVPNTFDNPLNVDAGEYDVRNKRNAKSKELSDDDIEQEIYEELVESYDDNDDENVQTNKHGSNDESFINSNDNGEKYYRDTFMDRIIEDMKVKRPDNVVKKEKRDITYKSMYGKDRELTGDTVLHLHSEMSDVIKSETDLKGTLFPDNHFYKEKVKSDSYVDNIMIHPSEFIQDTTPFQSDDNKKTSGKDSGDGVNAEQMRDTQSDWPGNRDNNDSFEDNMTMFNDTDVILAVLDSRKLLRCHLPVTDVKAIVWLKDGEKIPVSGSAASSYEMTVKGDIVIKRIGREHQGKWRCEEQGAGDNVLHAADKDRELLVMETPSPPYLEVFGRRLDPGNHFLPAREGTELVMACHVERGSPIPTLRWETSKPMHMTYQHMRGPQVTSSIATTVVRRSHHNTTISCICKHPALDAPITASTLLHVQYAPRFGISRTPGFGFPLEEGSAVSLRCEVDSNPPATPTWRKDEKEPPVEQTDDGYLNFTSVRREHSGWYKCSASHPLGNFSSIGYFLNVRYEVESATEQQVYHHTAGRSEEHLAGGVVQLQCPPGSVGCWSREYPTPPSSAPVGLLKQDKQGGSYVCSGLSPSEASRLHAMLGEHNALSGGAPVVYPSNASLTVKEDSSLTLEGEFCVEAGQAPARILWLAQGRALGLPDNYNRITTHHFTPTNSTASLQCNVAKLSINKCTSSDSGEYSLVVRGKRGIGEAIFHVQVLERDKHTLLEQVYSEGGSAMATCYTSTLFIVSMFFWLSFLSC